MKPITRAVLSLLLLSLPFLLLQTGCGKKGDRPLPPPNAAFRVIELPCPTGKTLTVAVWYPTASPARPFRYAGSREGNVAPGAPFYAGLAPCPLLVFSHGYGGSGISYVYLTEALARRGWVVAAPDHHDPQSAVRIKGGKPKDFDARKFFREIMKIAATGPAERSAYRYRIDEMLAVLDGMFRSDFAPFLRRDLVAVGGHSMGGFSATGVCGAWENWKGGKIRALLLLSTASTACIYTRAELSRVKAPTMLFMGEKERMRARKHSTVGRLHAFLYGVFPPPKYFLEVRNGNHFTFNDYMGESKLLGRVLGGNPAQHEVIRRYSAVFLEKYVMGRGEMPAERDPMLTRLLFDTGE